MNTGLLWRHCVEHNPQQSYTATSLRPWMGTFEPCVFTEGSRAISGMARPNRILVHDPNPAACIKPTALLHTPTAVEKGVGIASGWGLGQRACHPLQRKDT